MRSFAATASDDIEEAVGAGAAEVRCAESMDQACALAAENPIAVLAGEDAGQFPVGFDMWNSPTACTPEMVGNNPLVLVTLNGILPLITEEADRVGDDAVYRALATGDTRHTAMSPDSHTCKMYSWAEVETLVCDAEGELVDGSASNWAALADPATVERIEANSRRWQRFLEHETDACREFGARDGGTHILFAARQRTA